MPPIHDFTLRGCHALITGASSGLGAEFARQLAPLANSLHLVARRVELLHSLRSQLLQAHPGLQVEIHLADLADPTQRRRLIAELVERRLPLNLLINNAGVGDYGSISSADWERLEAMMQINMLALVELSHGLLPLLLNQAPSRILQVGSLAGSMPLPGFALYAASKGFVRQFSEALNLECESQGLRVTCLCPGPTPTEFSRHARREQGGDTDRRGHGLLRQAPEQVVAAGLRGVQRAAACVHPGLGVWLLARLCQFIPMSLLRRVLRWRHQSH
jgi:short-subunit dehydrogenase